MSDEIDRAQAAEARDRDLAIRGTQRRIADSFAARDVSVDGVCIDCGEPIEPARLLALDHRTGRCAHCARDREQRMRGYRR